MNLPATRPAASLRSRPPDGRARLRAGWGGRGFKPGWVALAAGLVAGGASGRGAVLYSNDFESPNGFVDTTLKDVSGQAVNTLYGQPGFLFQQVNTVETLEIQGGVAFGGYLDPEGLGGNYAIGMLSLVQDDRLSLTFDASGYDFLNVGLDISAIDLDGVGGPFGVAQPIFRLNLYDSPGGVFNIDAPGTLLDTADLTGTGVPNFRTFDWTSLTAALDAGASTDGNVSLVLDLLQSGYAAFDNIRVVSSDVPGDLEINGVPETSTWLAGGMALGLGVAGYGMGRWKRARR